MAGDWIKIEASTPDKPEVFMIADILGIDPDAAFGKLFRVWSWFDQHTEDGNAPSVTKVIIDKQAGVMGFADAMQAAGWLSTEEQFLQIPNFDRHNGKSAKKRALTAKRVAEHKQRANADGNASSVTTALPREEKRRYKPPPVSPPSSEGGETRAPRRPRDEGKTILPEDWELPDEWRRQGEAVLVKCGCAPGEVNLDAEAIAFHGHYRSEQKTSGDFCALWRKWLVTAAGRARKDGARPARGGPAERPPSKPFPFLPGQRGGQS